MKKPVFGYRVKMNIFKEFNASKKLYSALALHRPKNIRWATLHFWDLMIFLQQKKLQKVSYRNASLLHFLNPHMSQWAHLLYDSKIYSYIKVGYSVIRFLDRDVVLSLFFDIVCIHYTMYLAYCN